MAIALVVNTSFSLRIVTLSNSVYKNTQPIYHRLRRYSNPSCVHKTLFMYTLFIPNENDFRHWMREAIKESLENTPIKNAFSENPDEEALLTPKEITGIFRISLVTLHDWMKPGLPSHKQQGRVYFLRSEVIAYVKQKRCSNFLNAEQWES